MKAYQTLAISLCCLSGSTFADIQAVYDFAGQQMDIVVKNDQQMRMNFAQGQFLLRQGDDVYSVSGDPKQGYIAISLKDIAGVAFGGQSTEAAATEMKPEIVNTGKTEKVAGFPGNIFIATYMQNGKKVRSEMVLSKDARLIEIRRALLDMTAKWASMVGADGALPKQFAQMEKQLDGYGGLLRLDDDMRLLKVNKVSKGADYYSLPANTRIQDLSMVSGMLGGTKNMNCEGEAAEYNPLCLMQEATGEAVDESKNEAKQEAKEKVKEKVKGFLKDLF